MTMLITRAKDVQNADFREWYLQALADGLTYRQFAARHNLSSTVVRKHLEILYAVVPDMENFPLARRLDETKRHASRRQSIDPHGAKIRTNFTSTQEADAFVERMRQAVQASETCQPTP